MLDVASHKSETIPESDQSRLQHYDSVIDAATPGSKKLALE